MKSVKVCLLLALLGLAGVCEAGSFSGTVTTNEVPILGSPATTAPAWETGTAYEVGERVKSNGTVYLVIAAGTSTTAPAGPDDVVAGATFRPVLPKKRTVLIVQNTGSAVLYLKVLGHGSPIELSAGGSLTMVGDATFSGRMLASSDTSTTYAVVEKH